MSVTHDPIRFWALLQPGRTALKSERHEWSYAELEAAVAAASEALLARGLGAGEHVALEFPPEEGALLAITLHAAHRLGLFASMGAVIIGNVAMSMITGCCMFALFSILGASGYSHLAKGILWFFTCVLFLKRLKYRG